MPNQLDPESAIVGIWHEQVSEESNTFLGSGAFIAPRYVLTAKHVVDLQKYPKGFHLGLTEGQLSVPVKDKNIHRHDQLDIALIELDADIKGQNCISLDFGKSDLTGKKVDFFAVDPESHNRAQHKDHTIANKHHESGTYKVDHRVLKGFSGGVAVLDNRAVGLIVERHETDPITLIIPLSLVSDWLVQWLPPAFLPPAHPILSPGSQQTQSACTQRIRQEISQLLTRLKLRDLRDSLLRQAAERQPDKAPPVNPVDLLVPPQAAFDVESSIDGLHAAVENCLQRLTDQGSSAISDFVDDATTVLGWLVLLAVSETWLQEKTGLLERLLSADHITIPIPVATEAGTAVVIARLHMHRAKLGLGSDGVRVFNPNQLSWAELEGGITTGDRLKEIKKLIYKTVMKSDAPTFSSGEAEELKETLATRYKRGQNYYILIPARDDGSPAVDPAVDNAILTQLRRDFPHLGAFLIGAEAGDRVLVMPERRLVVLVREFLLMLRKY